MNFQYLIKVQLARMIKFNRSALCIIIFFVSQSLIFSYTPETIYAGTGKYAYGEGNELISNISPDGDKEAKLGNIYLPEGGVFILPANIDVLQDILPYANDVFNPLGQIVNSMSGIENDYKPRDIVIIDDVGEVYTAFIYARDYFELYVNGYPVAKDKLVYSPLNSNYVRFKAARPFLISIRVVNWEDVLNLGLQAYSSLENGVRVNKYKTRIGGLLMAIVDDFGDLVSKTNTDWRAQTYYISPIVKLSCVREKIFPHIIDTSKCEIPIQSSGKFPQLASLHWDVPENWYSYDYLDDNLPQAKEFLIDEYSELNDEVYQNFIGLFPREEFHMIWSNNIYLDNDVIFRYLVE